MNTDPINKIRMRVVTVAVPAHARKRNQWLLVAAAGVFIATVVYITRPAHGDSVRIVGFLPQVQRSVKAEPTVIDYTSMTATLATATPQPPMGVL